MAVHFLKGPLTCEDVEKLEINDLVYVSGPVFTCRSRLHRYIFDEGHELPFSTENRNCLIHVGPIIIKDQDRWKLVSFMPTSSIRFEKWGARSVAEWNLKMIIGKTTMGKDTAAMMKEKKCVHVSPQSVSSNLWVESIKVEDVYLFDELGTIEAAWHMRLDKLGPFVVDIDCRGNNLFDRLDATIEANKQKAYEMLGIPKDFQYTKLY
jgi:tartrate/fumarate subfamily iron-sulfur-dependent hydro-lyase beta chain